MFSPLASITCYAELNCSNIPLVKKSRLQSIIGDSDFVCLKG